MSTETIDWFTQMMKQQEERKRQLLMKLTDGELLAWADKMDAEGFELKMTWDGGGDSGWIVFECDKTELTDEDEAMIELLKNICDNELDYGSWAGEFSASGEAIYNSYTKCFEGMDYYSEDHEIKRDCAIKVTIPEDLWFNSIEIAIQDEEINVTTDIIVRNGFKTDLHTRWESEINQDVEDQVQEVVNKVVKDGHEYRSMWEEITLTASDFTSNSDGTKTAMITSIDVGVFESDEKEICINLKPEQD